MGNFAMVTVGRYELLYAAIPFVVVGFLWSDKFTIAGMGKDQATSLGLNYASVMYVGLGVVAGITAVVVASVGRIPFLGLIIPNIITLYRGDHLRSNFFAAGCLGPCFVRSGYCRADCDCSLRDPHRPHRGRSGQRRFPVPVGKEAAQ